MLFLAPKKQVQTGSMNCKETQPISLRTPSCGVTQPISFYFKTRTYWFSTPSRRQSGDMEDIEQPSNLAEQDVAAAPSDAMSRQKLRSRNEPNP